MPATKMLITVPAMIWSIFHVTAHRARNTPSSAPESDAGEHAGPDAAGGRRGVEAGERRHQQLALDADVDDAGALAEQAAQRAQHERRRLAERAS